MTKLPENTLFDKMTVHGFNKGLRDNWLLGTVVGTSGNQSYKIKLTEGKILQRHADHIRHRQYDCSVPDNEDDIDDIPIPISQQQPASGNAPTELCHSQRPHRPPEPFKS